MKETIIILGAGVMQGPAINIAKELGYHTIALDGSAFAPCVDMADRFEQIDLKDKESIETFARSIQSAAKRLGIMTAGTDFSASVAWTAEKLGLPGIPYEAALNASDKSKMRERLKKSNLPSPDFITINADDLKDFIINEKSDKNNIDHFSLLFANCSLSFPLVIKPVDNMGSRGCRRVNNANEFFKAAKNAIDFSRSGRAIAESYMDGPEFSVDAIVYKEEIIICGLADRHIFFPPYFIEMGHTMPTIIEKEKQEAILNTFRCGIRALGIAGKDNVGAAKGDIKLTEKGPMIGEIAARLSGGYMSGWTYPYSSGALPVKAAIQIAMGKKPEGITPSKKWTCAERAFISIPGTVKQRTINREQLTESNEQLAVSHSQFSTLNSQFINDFFLRINEGSKVSFPENNVTKCGNIIASAEDRQKAIDAAENAARAVLIRLDPSDEETEKFLHTEARDFPPNAFLLTDELIETLNMLPEGIKIDSHKGTEAQRIKKEENKKTFGNLEINQIKDELANPTNNPLVPSCLRVSSSFNPPCLRVTPFPAFSSSNLRDYMGRTPEEALQAVRVLTGFDLPITSENADNTMRLGRSFWAALIRGSYQGAVYYIDRLMEVK